MSFEEWFDQHFGSTDTDVAQAPPPDPYGFSLGRAARNAWDMTGEGPSAREQEAAAPRPPPPPPGLDGWSFNRAVQNFPRQIPEVYDRLKQQILPPGFSVQRGMDSALGPAKWLFNEYRQGVLPDEAIENIKKDPTSLDSLGAYLNAAISLSRGADGEPIPLPEKPGAMPLHVWNSMKPLDMGPGKTYMTGQGGEIRVDNAGNHFQMEGTHKDATTGQTHVIAKQIEPPGSGTPLQSDADVPPSQQTFLPSENKQHWTTWSELGPDQKKWWYDQWKQGKTPTMQDMMDSLYGKGAGTEEGVVEHDDPFQKFLQEQYPEGTSGMFTNPETLPPGELSKGPSKPLKPEPGSAMDDKQKLQEQQSIWDEWSKKHGGLKPDFGPPEELPPPPNLTPPDTLFPYNPRESLGGIQIPPGEGSRPGSATPEEPLNKAGAGMSIQEIADQKQKDLNSMSLDDYAKKWGIKGKKFDPGSGDQSYYDSNLEQDRAANWWKNADPPTPTDYPKPPNTDPWDQPPSGTPPPEMQPDDKTKRDWDQINKWYFMKNRFKWKPPPEHGGNNL